ncbi:unnamed protein product [Closterium sp. Naga37s-1]|nr:unnamed protein product [Closterium sp. Naga37s-1]
MNCFRFGQVIRDDSPPRHHQHQHRGVHGHSWHGCTRPVLADDACDDGDEHDGYGVRPGVPRSQSKEKERRQQQQEVQTQTQAQAQPQPQAQAQAQPQTEAQAQAQQVDASQSFEREQQRRVCAGNTAEQGVGEGHAEENAFQQQQQASKHSKHSKHGKQERTGMLGGFMSAPASPMFRTSKHAPSAAPSAAPAGSSGSAAADSSSSATSSRPSSRDGGGSASGRSLRRDGLSAGPSSGRRGSSSGRGPSSAVLPLPGGGGSNLPGILTRNFSRNSSSSTASTPPLAPNTPSAYPPKSPSVKEKEKARERERGERGGEGKGERERGRSGVGSSSGRERGPLENADIEALRELQLRHRLHIFSYAELRAATKNFAPENLLGSGGFGRVYRGEVALPSLANPAGEAGNSGEIALEAGGWEGEGAEERGEAGEQGAGGRVEVAVKKLNSKSMQGHKEWMVEVSLLAAASHPHLVRLMGCCAEGDRRLLVYELLPRGSLDRLLFRPSSTSSANPSAAAGGGGVGEAGQGAGGGRGAVLDWGTRLKVALGAAKGLAYLHEEMEPRVRGRGGGGEEGRERVWREWGEVGGRVRRGSGGASRQVVQQSHNRAVDGRCCGRGQEARGSTEGRVEFEGNFSMTAERLLWLLLTVSRAIQRPSLAPPLASPIPLALLLPLLFLLLLLSSPLLAYPRISTLPICHNFSFPIELIPPHVFFATLLSPPCSPRLPPFSPTLSFPPSSNVIYRDLKTSNVLLTESFQAKLSDFGLAREGPEGDSEYVSTMVRGTAGYAAPEYMLTGQLTSKNDVWSFGVLLLELLTGRPSIDGKRGVGQGGVGQGGVGRASGWWDKQGGVGQAGGSGAGRGEWGRQGGVGQAGGSGAGRGEWGRQGGVGQARRSGAGRGEWGRQGGVGQAGGSGAGRGEWGRQGGVVQAGGSGAGRGEWGRQGGVGQAGGSRAGRGEWGRQGGVGQAGGSGAGRGEWGRQRGVGQAEGSGAGRGEWGRQRGVGQAEGSGAGRGEWGRQRGVGQAEGSGAGRGEWGRQRGVGQAEGSGAGRGEWGRQRGVGQAIPNPQTPPQSWATPGGQSGAVCAALPAAASGHSKDHGPCSHRRLFRPLIVSTLSPTRPHPEANLVLYARPYLQQPADIVKIMDPALIAASPPPAAAAKVAEVARWCLAMDPTHRPVMSQVVDVLTFLSSQQWS